MYESAAGFDSDLLRILQYVKKRMHIGSKRIVWLYAGLALVGVLVSLLGFVRLAGEVGHAFGGFIWQYDDVRGYSVSYDVPAYWAGPQRGLPPYTPLLAVDGQPPGEFAAIYAAKSPGEVVVYTAGGQFGIARQVGVPVERFRWVDVWAAYGPIALTAYTFTIAGFMLLRTAQNTSRRIIAWGMLVGAMPAFYHTHHGSISQLYYPRPLAAVMWAPCPALLGALLIHLALVYPHRYAALLARRWLLPTLYGLAICLALGLSFSYFGGGFTAVAAWQPLLTNASLGFMVLGALATVISGIWISIFQRKQVEPIERRQARILASAWVLIVVILVGTLAAANLRWPTPFGSLSAVAWLLPLGVIYAIGNADLVARLEQENATRADLLIEVQAAHELEARILNDVADDLHDTAMAESKAIEMRLFTLSQQLTNGTSDTSQLHDEIARLHRNSLALRQNLRRVVEGAKPVNFEQEGLGEALARIVGQLNAADAHTCYRLRVAGPVESCPLELKREIYWIIRAALNNVRDHAAAQQCDVTLACSDTQITIAICDTGTGVPKRAPVELAAFPQRQLGLASMRTRTTRLGGTLEFTRSPAGAQVQILIPRGNTGAAQ